MTTSPIKYRVVVGIEEMKEIVFFQGEIWGHEVVTPLTQLVAASHHGGIVIGAFQEEKVIGFTYGFPGFKDGRAYLISHMTAVHPKHQNAGIGYALKLAQREWAIKTGGYKKIVWTYDPLEARNAYFNLVKLGGYARQYIKEYYGLMDDKLNKGLPTDRFLIEWDITSKRVERAISDQHSLSDSVHTYPFVLLRELEKTPSVKLEESAGYLVPVPKNIQQIKIQDIQLAKSWRDDLRLFFTELLAKDFVVTGIMKDRDPSYQFYVIENSNLGVLDD
ncbi:GNAT family N-acetyltransferase [Sutcliffiella halmapala]|uniref:GNAT family N-acetyltransferase n=1 Tax=Sutcliffiella halmapala TaxID=79882 RepID=UPI000995C36F|nr:GNAT family N-acetyltransferase [Sutcliffiella halmapala]